MASIRKRGNKWHVQVRRGGQSCTRSFSLKSDAEQWARKRERDIDTEEFSSSSEQLSSLTLGSLLDRYQREVLPRKRSAGSVETYMIKRYLNHRMSRLRLKDLRPEIVNKYKEERLSQVQEGTLLRELGVLRHCLEVARKDWGIPSETIQLQVSECPPGRNPAREGSEKRNYVPLRPHLPILGYGLLSRWRSKQE